MMPRSYVDATEKLSELRDQIMRRYERHRPLVDHDVEIGLTFVYQDPDSDKPAIAHRGQRALGLCRVVPERDRSHGLPDAMIYLDGDWWKEATESERISLLDHELTHLQVAPATATDDDDDTQSGGTGADCKRDGQGRPKLKMRRHDFEIGIFLDCIESHQEQAVDFKAVQNVAKAARELIQREFWG